MSAQPKLNISAVIGIREGIHQVFSLIEQNLDAYSKRPDNMNPIRDCRNFMRQLDGLLEMLELTSIKIVTEKMAQLFEALISKEIPVDDKVVAALKQSIKALLFYLNQLIDGAEENPLRLYPAYRELMQVSGAERALESDLFFPRLIVDPPLKAVSEQLEPMTVKALAKQIGTEYQAGLLKWLRDPSSPDGLPQMMRAVNQIEGFPGTLEQRSFWWVAAGFIEDLSQQKTQQSVELAVRRLCGKIEQSIRHLAVGTLDNTMPLMRELLYCIAHSESDNARIQDIKNSYVWPGQAAAVSAVTYEAAETVRPVLEKIRSAVMFANDRWREFYAGQQESLAPLLTNIGEIEQLAKQSQCHPLEKLSAVISGVIASLRDHPQDLSEELAMEMATALLLVDSILDDFNKLSPDLPNQIEILASRMLSITAGTVDEEELPEAPVFSDIESDSQDKEITSQVGKEILVNLGEIENSLDKFFFEPSKRSELLRLSPLFKQISGALVMLDLERANHLLNLCHNLVAKLLDPDYEIIETEQILLVDGLSSLGFFIEAIRSKQPESDQIVEKAIDLFETALTMKALPVSSPEMKQEAKVQPVPEPIKTERTDLDPELLEIFLEEADEILVAMFNDIKSCRQNAADSESLMNIRRGFHTLKGSGRMVKLLEMSEVAWHLEQVLNRWLREQKPVTDPLMRLIAQAHQQYSHWCKILREQGNVEAKASDLLRLAQDFIDGKETFAAEVEVEAKAVSVPARNAAVKQKTAQKTAVDHVATIQPKTKARVQSSSKLKSSVQPAAKQTDKINPELLQVFLEETQNIIPQMGGKLRAWRMLPQDADIHRALLRLLHTLKGSARMAGAADLGELIHGMESHVEAAFNGQSISDAALDQLESEFDAISEKIEQLYPLATPLAAAKHAAIPVSFETPAADQDFSEGPELFQSKTVLRINSELIDRLVNDAGESSILRSKIETQLNSFKQSLQDLSESSRRLHDQLREIEIQAETQMQSHRVLQQDADHRFDPLELDRFTRFQELTRLMAESVDDVITVQKSLRKSHTVAEEAVNQQAVINRQLQQSLLQIRTIPFSNSAERYYRIARQVAEDMGKKAHLEIQGGEVEIDRSVLEKINPPLEHLLRNAIAHGIEEPAQRQQAGKPETGQVKIQLRQEGNEVIITLSDDGRGLNLPRIREEALCLGLIRKSQVLSQDKLMSLIFTQGLSTTDSVTGIAGRGIGLDIVKNEVTMLGGRIDVSSVSGQGTTFTIHLPFTLAVAQTVMVRAGKQIYAIPLFIVAYQQQMDQAALKSSYQSHQIELNGKAYPFSHLSHLLGETDHMPEMTKSNRVLFLHSGTQHLAVQVDEWLGNTEVVAKNIGAQLAHAPGVEGATITGDGEVILILNPVKLMQRGDVQKIFSTPLPALSAASKAKKVKVPTIMVVDDSLTVRKVTCRLLEREGCDVLIAKNGLEAVSILQDTIPDVMLIDLEMPKMNGFELIENVRAAPETENIPIIIISSRSAEKHQQIAKGLGVNVFLGKPYKEEELLMHLSQYIKH